MRKSSIRKKKLSKECWNLDRSFLIWINEHFKVFYKDASKHINLTYHKFTYNGKEYTQEEIIKRIISLSDELLANNINYNNVEDKRDELLDLWKLVFPAMWW